jgi:hypothetical protein
MVSKKMDNQALIWGIGITLAVIVIGVIIYFIWKHNRDKKHEQEDYIDIDQEDYLIENYEENQYIHKYFVDSYVANYIEDYELLLGGEDHPINQHFNKVFHIGKLADVEPNLNVVRHEADRIGLHQGLAKRILETPESARRFSATLNAHLSKKEPMFKILQATTPELVEDVKNVMKEHKLEQTGVEKFRFEYYEEENRGLELLNKKLKIQERVVRKLKECLHRHLHNGHEVSKLPHHPEVKKRARLAHVDKETLHKITSCLEETKKFILGETTLEHYSPDLFIENWGLFSDIGNAFKSVGNAVANVAQTAARTVVDTAKYVGNKIADTAVEVGEGIKNAAATVGNAVVDVATKIVKGATAAFDTVKSTISNGFDNALKGIVWLGQEIAKLGDIAWGYIKEIISEGIKLLLNFMQEYFPALLGKYIRCKINPPQALLTPCEGNNFEINDTKLEVFMLKKLEDIIANILATAGFPAVKLLLAIPGARDLLNKAIGPLFKDYVWSHIRELISKYLLQPLIDAIAKGSNIKVSLAEWYRYMNMLEDYEEEVRSGTFKPKWKEHIRACIKKCREMEAGSDRRACMRECKQKVETFSVLQESVQCRNKCLRENDKLRDRAVCMKKCAKIPENFTGQGGHGILHNLDVEKREKIHSILSMVISEQHKDHLPLLVNEILNICKSN